MSTNTYIDVHVIQTLPPSNVNRDDTGSPKTAVFGGVTRARVSSQAWKRATRLAFENFLDSKDLGLRTKRVVEVLLTRTASLAPDLTEDARLEAVRSVLTSALGVKLTKNKKDDPYEESGYLVFLSNLQLDSLAEAAVKVARGEEFDKKALTAIVKENNSIDLALFGRMVADVTDLRVDAAAQVAHAISVHAVENEFDYYTAIDDDKSKDAEEDAGAGMIGTVEFNSSTLYRYATVSVHRLRENLGDDEAVVRGVEAFVRGFRGVDAIWQAEHLREPHLAGRGDPHGPRRPAGQLGRCVRGGDHRCGVCRQGVHGARPLCDRSGEGVRQRAASHLGCARRRGGRTAG